MIGIKHGVRLLGMSPQNTLAVIVTDQVLAAHKTGDAIITSASDGRHARGSLHYAGHAVDMRTRTIPGGLRSVIAAEIGTRLGEEYDVILEADHLHIEWQPKGG